MNDVERAAAAYVAGHIHGALARARADDLLPMVDSLEVTDATHIVVHFAERVEVVRQVVIDVTATQ